jgi:hypothetical protein
MEEEEIDDFIKLLQNADTFMQMIAKNKFKKTKLPN